MIIHNPVITGAGHEISIACKIEIQNKESHLPEILWFKLPADYRDCVNELSDPFAVALLPTAMALGEDMAVKGHLSPRLAWGMREYQHVQHSWWSNRMAVIEVIHDGFAKEDEIETKGAVGCAFSGGVDSFYSLWTHLAENEAISQYRITHCLMINGFDNDVDLDNTGYFQKIQQNYEPMMHGLGVKPIVVKTNLRQFRLAPIGRPHLHESFGAPITACALILGRLFGRFYLPSSYHYESLIPDGAHPMLDHLLSTGYMEIIHDGAQASRVQKTSVIGQWPETFSRLRVCFKKTKFRENSSAIENCCRCEKCIRTMAALDLLGLLHKHDTFPLSLKRRHFRKVNYLSESSRIYAKEILALARKKNRKAMEFDVQYALFRGYVIKISVLPLLGRLPDGAKSWLRSRKRDGKRTMR